MTSAKVKSHLIVSLIAWRFSVLALVRVNSAVDEALEEAMKESGGCGMGSGLGPFRCSYSPDSRLTSSSRTKNEDSLAAIYLHQAKVEV